MDLLERDAQRALLSDVFEQVCAPARAGAVALVSGEAGIGKTAFVSEFAAAERARARVLWGACDPLFTPRALGPIYDIAVHDLPHLLELLNAGAGWFAIAAALHQALVESPRPAMLVFEDIHWADEATLDLVKYLGRRAAKGAYVLILTYREDEVSAKHPLRSVLGNLATQHPLHLRLDPLSPGAVAALAAKMHRSPQGIYEVTRGNPFFVTEVLRSSGQAPPPGSELPVTIRDAVLGRASHLDEPARGLLELAAIIPGPAELWLLEAVLQPDPAAIDACVESGFLLPAGGALVFRHELARIAMEGALPPGRAKALHRKVIAALEQAPERPGRDILLARLVHHAACAADAHKVLEYAPLAAAQASRQGAHREALQYYQATIPYRHLAPGVAQARLLDGLSFEYYLTAQIERAIQARQEAVELWRKAGQPQRVGDDVRWLSRLYWFQGEKALADHCAGEAIAVLEPLAPGKELAMAYSNRAQLYMLAEAGEAAVVWGNKALALAEALHETEITIHALTNLGTAEAANGSLAGRAQLEQALRLAQAHEMHDHVARCYANLISRTIENRDYPAAERYLAEGLAYTTDRDMDSYSVYLLGWQARWFFEQGRWDEAAAAAHEVQRRQPGAAVMALPGMITLGQLLARQGDPQSAHWLDRAQELALSTGEFQRIAPLAVARAEAAWWAGQPDRALQEIQPAAQLADANKSRFLLGAIAYWLWRVGGEARWQGEIPPAYGAMVRGDWRSAADEWARIGCPFERAQALAEGDPAAQRQALAIFESLGARPAARALREQLAEQGVKRLPRGARPSTRANPAGLTEREMAVLALLGRGLSNAEIASALSISAKTVDHHVSAILGKLQAASRLEAVALARQKQWL